VRPFFRAGLRPPSPPGYPPSNGYGRNSTMRIDEEGNMELSAEENQDLMDRLEIPESDYDDPPVEIECTGMEDNVAIFAARNTKTGKLVVMEFDLMDDADG
jgi:hypothetical protein